MTEEAVCGKEVEMIRKFVDKKDHYDAETVKLLTIAFDSIPVPMIVIDNEEKVKFITEYYAKFLNVNKNEAIGKHIYSVIENSRLPIVLKTGKAEKFYRHQYVDGREVMVDKYPIKKNGETIGCFAILTFTSMEELREVLNKNKLLSDELSNYKNEVNRLFRAKYSLNDIKGISDEIKYCKDQSVRLAKSSSPVMITGESGVGKELFAHSIHNKSLRWDKPFITINCAAIPESLFESELFGYEDGAFTGAKKGGKMGKFEIAHMGTLFLDEIGDMPIAMQAKLLRVLQEGELIKVGGMESKQIDVRIIAATGVDLEKLVAEGSFRKDLYYRLNILSLQIPPLRNRKNDIPVIVEHIMNELTTKLGLTKKLKEEVIDLLMNCEWPGNIRQLKSTLEKLILNSEEDQITKKDIPLKLFNELGAGASDLDCSCGLDQAIGNIEKEMIMKSISLNDGNKHEAAKQLNISRPRLYRKLEKYKLL